MAPFSKADAAIFVRDGLPATSPVGCGKVHLEYPEALEQFGGLSRPGQIAAHPCMTYITVEFPGLVNGTEVEIDGAGFRVMSAQQIGDGTFSKAELKKG